MDLPRIRLSCLTSVEYAPPWWGRASQYMDLVFIHFSPISQSCHALCWWFDIVLDSVYQILGCGYQQKCIPIAFPFCCMWRVTSSILFVISVVCYSVLGSLQTLFGETLVVCPILYILGFHRFELLHFMVFCFRVISRDLVVMAPLLLSW